MSKNTKPNRSLERFKAWLADPVCGLSAGHFVDPKRFADKWAIYIGVDYTQEQLCVIGIVDDEALFDEVRLILPILSRLAVSQALKTMPDCISFPVNTFLWGPDLFEKITLP
jgi:hypothetical protein